MDNASRSKAMVPYDAGRNITVPVAMPTQLPPGACSISEIANKVLSQVYPVSIKSGYRNYLRDMTNAHCQLVIDGEMFTDFYNIPVERQGQMNGEFLKTMIESAFNGRPTFFTNLAAFRLRFVSLDKASGCKVLVTIHAISNPGHNDLTGIPWLVELCEDGHEFIILDKGYNPFYSPVLYVQEVAEIEQGCNSIKKEICN